MKKTLMLLMALVAMLTASAATTNPQVVVDLVNRVCGSGASSNFTFTLNETFNDNGKEQFQISGSANAIQIKGTTLSALTCGLNWYLKHDAHVDICWNNLRETPASYPAPTPVTKTCDVPWRYYLNYCTFSYSMSVWGWDRWEQELDWMALHGVNLPLQCVGIDAVWYQLLKNEYGYSLADINNFVADPMHQGWWLMNNLTGAPLSNTLTDEFSNLNAPKTKNPEWWYQRQAWLGKKITDRMRELGMTPCLPGFVGMAPDKFITDKGVSSYTGGWQKYTSPQIINPLNETGAAAFTELGGKYYNYITNVFGFTPKAFSLDPFHERTNSAGSGYSTICDKARDLMNAASPNALWVAQEWQVNADQIRINALPVANTLLLDLSSERLSYRSCYGSHDYAFCMLHNYGGNIGMYGCIEQMLTNYDAHKGESGTGKGVLKGVGATPEGIEQNPVMYELLFEMPWLGSKPNAVDWLEEYATCRYNLTSSDDIANARTAWSKLLSTVYNQNSSNQQGCTEPLLCVRPNKYFESSSDNVDVSAWAHGERTWDKNDVIDAARKILAVSGQNDNYVYDLVDVVRQVMADKTETVLSEMRAIYKSSGKACLTNPDFVAKKQVLYNLIDHSDQLLSYVPDFTINQWVNRARNIVAEAQTIPGVTVANPTNDADWLELLSRTLITTWGMKDACNSGNLRDYGNREWAGLLKDMYKKRWEFYFEKNNMENCKPWKWYDYVELPFIVGGTNSYTGYTFPALGSYPESAVGTSANAPQVRQQLLEMLK